MRPDPIRDQALTLFQPPGTGLRIALVTGRGGREGRVDWVRHDGGDVEQVVAAAFDLGATLGATAVISGGPSMAEDHVTTVLGLCLGSAGFDGLRPGRELTASAANAAAGTRAV